MIFLEQTINQIINEEGQLILSLADLGITWDKLEKVFIGTYEQAKGYITIYDWENKVLSTDMQQQDDDVANIKHITYNAAYNMQRIMPDMPRQYWEFNPYTRNMASLMSTNFSLEVAKYPTLGQLDYTLTFDNVKKGTKYTYTLPFTMDVDNIEIIGTNEDLTTTTLSCSNKEVTYDNNDTSGENTYLTNNKHCICCDDEDVEQVIETMGDANGSFDEGSLTGYLRFTKDYNKITINLKSKYVGIKELDLTCELFYVWFKGNVLTMMGRIKKQIDMSQSGIPFDLGQDGLLERAAELMNKVEELKTSKSHWSNF